MTREAIQAIFLALNQAGVRYLVVGGLAVVAHGYVRFTADVDLVLDPEIDNLRRAVAVFGQLGYQPRAPVPLEDFLDPAKRAQWRAEKGMVAFSLFSSQRARTEVDLFLEAPFDFSAALARAKHEEASPGVPVCMVGLADLLGMKRAAGRAKDLEDIRVLEQLHGKAADGPG